MKPLRIGIDARELLGATTGVGRYLGELLLRWTTRRDAGQRRFILYAPEALLAALPAAFVEQRVVSRGASGRGTWWEQMHLPRAVRGDQLDVFFAPAYTAPLTIAVPLAVTIHDVSFAAHPEWFRLREGLRRRWLTRHTAQRASVVFTDSEFSRSEIETLLHVEGSRIRVIPPGVRALKANGRRTSGEAGGPQRLVLFVGSLFNRRRLPDLIAAFARVAREVAETRLVIAGDDRTWPPLDLPGIAAAHGVSDRVTFTSYVEDDSLAELYSRASVFVFLSEYEGFGLTPLEALSAGVPIVVLDTAVAREVYGAAAHYVAADDVEGTAAVIRRLLLDPSSAARTLNEAPGVLARYSWDRAAERTLEHLERIAGR
jgi:glycosyltransferase involved in cell wall biosynthesis